MTLSTIKIPEKVYVGFQGRRSQDEVPLGFMTPYTTDQAGEKRRATVDSWAKGYGREKTFNSVILENKPMIGFKIGRAIRRHRSWGGNASYVRIEDPRGFELEISIENLVMCMDGNLMEDGEIMQECVWGRDGNRNILLPTNSEPFQASVTTKAKLDSVISLRDIKPGDKIKLVTGEEGVYFGSMYPLSVNSYDFPRTVTSGAKRYVLKQTDHKGVVTYVGRASLKVGDLLEKADTKLSPEEIEKDIIAGLANGATCQDSSHSYYVTCRIFLASDKFDTVGFSTHDITEAQVLADTDAFSRTAIIAENHDQQHLMLDTYYNFNPHSPRSHAGRGYYPNGYTYYNSKHVKTSGWIGKTVQVGTSILGKGRDNNNHFEISDTKRLFIVKVELKSKAGQTFTTAL